MEQLKQTMPLTAKGHVKLELYNDEGVFLTKEKKNLVVQSANEITAAILADPAKMVVVPQVDTGSTELVAEEEGYAMNLSAQNMKRVSYKNDLGSSNVEKIITVTELKGLETLKKVLVGSVPLVINKDVFVVDADEGKIEFKVAPVEAFEIQAVVLNDAYSKAIDSSESVEVNHVAYKRSDKASDSEKTYVYDHTLGKIFFETPKTDVKVTYKYKMFNSLGFMTLGGKPAGWPDKKPITFGNSDKLKTDMAGAELPKSRVRIQYPATTESGAKEIDPSIPTVPIESALMNDTVRIKVQADSETKVLEYDFSNVYTKGSVMINAQMLELKSVQNMTTGQEIKEFTQIVKSDLTGISLKFRDQDVNKDDFVKATYLLKISNKHLVYQLSQAPIIRLLNVRHIDSLDPKKIKDYNIVKDGLQSGFGDVWISNPATGHIQFSDSPTGGPVVETPGHLQVTYQINSGTTIRFVADFPKGVPGPVEIKETFSKTLVAGEGGNIVLPKTISKTELGVVKDIVVTMGEKTLTKDTEYTIALDAKTVTINSPISGQNVTIQYPTDEKTHDIYQVAMMNLKEQGKMFNISGIGPITKDENTGMRITWSVTI